MLGPKFSMLYPKVGSETDFLHRDERRCPMQLRGEKE